MSYARIGDHSDVYVYGDGKHLICCLCKRSEGTTTPAPLTERLAFYGARWAYSISQVVIDSIHVATFGFLHQIRPVISILDLPSRWYLFKAPTGCDTYSRDVLCDTPEQMLTHLKDVHLANGDKVPQYCLDRLLSESMVNKETIQILELISEIEYNTMQVAEEGNMLAMAYRKLSTFFKEYEGALPPDIKSRVSAMLSNTWYLLNNEE
jgi:hypothetical protein